MAAKKKTNKNGGDSNALPAKADAVVIPNKGVRARKVKRSPSSSPSLPISSILTIFLSFAFGTLTPPLLHASRFVFMSTMVQMYAPPDSSSSAGHRRLLPRHTPCDEAHLSQYLHDVPVPGLHVACVEPLNVDVDGNELEVEPLNVDDDFHSISSFDNYNALRVSFYPGAHARPLLRRVVIKGSSHNRFGGLGAAVQWKDVESTLTKHLSLAPEGPTQRPWAAFSAHGHRIVGPGDADIDGESVVRNLAAAGMIIIPNGGAWVWPGVREGFRRNIEIDDGSSHPRNATIETLSLKPLVLSIEGFLSHHECDHIAAEAGPSMQYSGVSLKDSDKGKVASEWRTSQSTFLSAKDDDLLRAIDHRTASLTRIPLRHQEFVQVLRYGRTEKYDAHHDFFDPAAYKSDRHTLGLIENGRRNRFATVFWYLSDVEKGGETIFPRHGGAPTPRNHADCSVGLKVKPRKGKVIIFYSLDAGGKLDPLSLHGACPVEEGIKWAANKWVWNGPMNYIQD